jgi:hypothetical protein
MGAVKRNIDGKAQVVFLIFPLGVFNKAPVCMRERTAEPGCLDSRIPPQELKEWID